MGYAHREYCNMLLTPSVVIVELVLMHGNVCYIILVDVIQMLFAYIMDHQTQHFIIKDVSYNNILRCM